MTTERAKELASKALKAIKAHILAEKKEFAKLPAKNYYAWCKAYPYADLGITLKHGWEGAKDEKYRLTINPYSQYRQNHIVETDTRGELEGVIRALFGLLNEQSKERGWKYIKVVRDYAEFGSGWNRVKVEYPSMVALLDAPCSEFNSLQNYLKKYAGITLPNFYIYNVRMGGKRGVLYAEEGERIYLDNRPKKCADLLAALRKFRGTKDTMVVKFGNEKYIDPIDKEYSCKHEIECDGEGRSYMTITIKTPQGRNKYETKVY